MKIQYAVAIALLTGVEPGAVAVQHLHAQARPPAYAIAEIDVTNQDGYVKEYLPPSSKVWIMARNISRVAAGRPQSRRATQAHSLACL